MNYKRTMSYKNVITVIHSLVNILKESGYEDISGYGKEVFNDLKNLFTQKPQDSFSFFQDNQITISDFEKVSENATEVLCSQDKLNKQLGEVGMSFQIGELLLRTDYSKFREHTDAIKNSSWYSPFFSRAYKEAKQMLNSLMLSVEKTPVNLERYEIVADSLKQAESFSSHDGAFKLGVSFTGIGTSAQYLNDILMHAKKLRTFYLSFNKFDISSDSVDRLSTLNLKAIIETIESNSKVSEDWSHDEVLEVYEARKELQKEVFQLLKVLG